MRSISETAARSCAKSTLARKVPSDLAQEKYPRTWPRKSTLGPDSPSGKAATTAHGPGAMIVQNAWGAPSEVGCLTLP